jgi:hypothetical protein
MVATFLDQYVLINRSLCPGFIVGLGRNGTEGEDLAVSPLRRGSSEGFDRCPCWNYCELFKAGIRLSLFGTQNHVARLFVVRRFTLL